MLPSCGAGVGIHGFEVGRLHIDVLATRDDIEYIGGGVIFRGVRTGG